MQTSARSGRIRLRLVGLLVLGLIGVVVSGGVYRALVVREYRLAEASFRYDAGQWVAAVQREFNENLQIVDALTAFYNASQIVELDEFRSFTQPFFAWHPGLAGLARASRVDETDRADHEVAARQQTHGEYQIWERDDQGHLVPAAPRDLYWPIYFLEPAGSRAVPPGFDLGSIPECREAIERAESDGQAAAVAKFDGESAESPPSVAIFAPVHPRVSRTKAVVRPRQPEGVVVAIVHPVEVVEYALRGAEVLGIDLHLFDETQPDAPVRLCARPAPARREPLVPWDSPSDAPSGILDRAEIPMAGRSWTVYATPTDRYLAAHQTWLPGMALGCGLLITGLVVTSAGALVGRTVRIERLVDRRTEELHDANASLQQEIAERRRAEAVLKDSEALYSSLVENLPVHVLRKDLEGRFTFANRSFCELLGRPLEEILGKTDFDFYPEELAGKYRRDDARMAETGDPFEDVEQYETDGQIRYMQVKKSPVRDANGRIVGIQAVFWDVSQQKWAAEQLARAKEAAEAASRAKSAFLANMSHEIRTPLGAIIGMTELALGTRLSVEQQEYLRAIQDSGETLLSLVNQILDFSKIEAGKLALDHVAFDLGDVLSDAVKSLGHRAHRKGLELACRIGPEVPEIVVGDCTRLRQVVANLVGNAIKFTQRGEVVIEADCQERSEGQVVLHIAVRDTGIGIPEDKQEAIFNAFEQADNTTTRKFGGTGLGLTICKRLVEMMGGAIWLDSQAGRGSTFHCTVRLGLPSADRGSAPPPEGLQGLPVLIVDDHATTRAITAELLGRWGADPVLADGAANALDLLRGARRSGHPIRLVLADAHMPQADGFALAEQIEQDPELKTPVLMMLVSGDRPGDITRCEQLGIAGYLLKPVKPSELQEAILAVLGIAAIHEDQAETVLQPKLKRSLRILLAEDSPVIQKLVAGVLERQGHTVVVVGTGREAVAAFQTRAVDLVLMDIQMPEMDGIEATVAIRAAETTRSRHVPIIALTAHALAGDRERCLEAGMDYYLTKPIRVGPLIEAIEAAVQSRPIAEAPAEASPLGEAPVDWKVALETVQGDQELLRVVIETFLEECPRLLSAIHQALAARAAGDLKRAAHTLKGSLNYFGACRAFEYAFRLERLAQEGNLEEAVAALHALEEEVARVCPALLYYLRGGSPAEE